MPWCEPGRLQTRIRAFENTAAAGGLTLFPALARPGVRGACEAFHRIVAEWPGGYQGQVTIRVGAAAISGWAVRMTFPVGQTIDQVWNGTLAVDEAAVLVRNVSYNRDLPAFASTTFGFTVSGAASCLRPACTIL